MNRSALNIQKSSQKQHISLTHYRSYQSPLLDLVNHSISTCGIKNITNVNKIIRLYSSFRSPNRSHFSFRCEIVVIVLYALSRARYLIHFPERFFGALRHNASAGIGSALLNWVSGAFVETSLFRRPTLPRARIYQSTVVCLPSIINAFSHKT